MTSNIIALSLHFFDLKSVIDKDKWSIFCCCMCVRLCVNSQCCGKCYCLQCFFHVMTVNMYPLLSSPITWMRRHRGQSDWSLINPQDSVLLETAWRVGDPAVTVGEEMVCILYIPATKSSADGLKEKGL